MNAVLKASSTQMIKKGDEKMRYIFFDMDGVLAEYRIYCGEHEMQEKGYFGSLKPEWNIILAVKELVKENANVYILTKVFPSFFTYSMEEKREWVEKIMPFFPMDHLIMVNGEKEEKSEAIRKKLGLDVNADCILIDDYNPNLYDWRKNGGTPVKYTNGVNDKTQSFDGYRINYMDTPDEILAKLHCIID